MKNIVVLFIFIGGFSACQQSSSSVGNETSFFDLAEFLQDKIASGVTYNNVTRNLFVDDEKETKEYSQYDMTQALSFLIQFNINRPRWYDKYDVNQSGSITTYTALVDDLQVQKMIIEKSENIIERVNIHFISKSLISHSEKNIDYNIDKTLKIQTTTKPFIGSKKSLNLEYIMN